MNGTPGSGMTNQTLKKLFRLKTPLLLFCRCRLARQINTQINNIYLSIYLSI